jgi:hypothetical protein
MFWSKKNAAKKVENAQKDRTSTGESIQIVSQATGALDKAVQQVREVRVVAQSLQQRMAEMSHTLDMKKA